MKSCYKTTNNKYFNCPPRMADGRHFTDYSPICDIDSKINLNNNLVTSHESREYLTNNALKLIELNRIEACKKNCCGPCQVPYNKGTMLPESSIQNCNNKSCNTKHLNNNGIGLGRDYGQLDCNFPNELPLNQVYSCCATSSKLFNYYNHVDNKAQGELLPRLTIPSGGKMMNGGDPQAFNL
jgi:hypothetical protein